MESWSMNADEAETRRHEAARRLGIAEEDARVARGCLRLEIPAPGSAAYHCQQVAEKVVKGLLVHCRRGFYTDARHGRVRRCRAGALSRAETRIGGCSSTGLLGNSVSLPPPEDVPEPLPSYADIERTISNIEALAARLQQLIDS